MRPGYKCDDCGSTTAELRRDMQPTAYGPRFALVCSGCYEKDAAERRADAKRSGFRSNVIPWNKLKIEQEAQP